MLAADLLADLDDIRSIPGEMGLHPYAVSMRTISWSGARPGVGTATTTTTPLTVGGQSPHVTQLSNDDVVASGGLYQIDDLRVGPLTPPFPGGGTALTSLDPSVTAAPLEVQFIVTGAGMPATGKVYHRVRDETDSALHYYVIIRDAGRAG